ncbi:unnamed protein product, partial [Mesorhabditis spiculigera]
MSGIIDKTKDAVSNAAEAVKDKFQEMTGTTPADRAKDNAQDAWDQTKDKAHDKKEDAKDWASDKLHEAGRKKVTFYAHPTAIMPGIIDKTKDAVSNAAEAVKDKFQEVTGTTPADRAEDNAKSAWNETKDRCCDKKEEAKDWASEKLHKAGRKIDEH